MDKYLREALEKVSFEAEKLGEETVRLSQALIRRPSEITPGGGNEEEAQRYLAGVLAGQKYDFIDWFRPDEVEGAVSHEAWWPDQSYDGRYNVVAVRKGTGGGRNLLLNGHMDVVPAGDDKFWKYPPFEGHIEGEFLYGRGACDMKSGVAVMCMAAEAVQRAGISLAGDLTLESVVCEETGVYNGTLACCVKGYRGDGAVVLEPTQREICRGIKGNHVYQVIIPGRATHNCLWWKGSSAFDNAIYFKKGLEEYQKLRTEKVGGHELYGDASRFPIPALVDDIWSIKIGDPEFFAVPDRAEIMFMLEMLPGEDREEVKREFEDFMASWCARHPFLKEHPPVFESPKFRPIFPVAVEEKDPLVECMCESVKHVNKKLPVIRGFESACDAMTLMLWGDTPAIIYGPGSLENAHEINEKIYVPDIVKAVRELAEFIVRYCGISEKSFRF